MGREEYSRRRKQHVQRSWGETKLVIGTRVSFTPYMALPFYPMVLWGKSFGCHRSQHEKSFPSPSKGRGRGECRVPWFGDQAARAWLCR